MNPPELPTDPEPGMWCDYCGTEPCGADDWCDAAAAMIRPKCLEQMAENTMEMSL